jgi:hypothetical protein
LGPINLRESFFGNGEEMGGLLCSRFASVYLDHLLGVQRVDLGKGIRRNEHDAGVGVDFFLGISKLDGL